MTQEDYISNRNDDAAERFGLELPPPDGMNLYGFWVLLAADAVGNSQLALSEQDEDDGSRRVNH